MKRLGVIVLVPFLLACFVASELQAQPPGNGPGFGRGFGGRGGRGGPEGREGGFRGGPTSPLMEALDTNKDGELSAEEIANAVTALKTLDKDKNGKLTEDELRPQFGGRGERGRGRDRESGLDPKELVTRMLTFDANKDGKLSKDELPERMVQLVERADTNQDGILDQDELLKVAEQQIARRREAQGEQPERGERPGPREGESRRPRGGGQ